jgi:hypothetical protein
MRCVQCATLLRGVVCEARAVKPAALHAINKHAASAPPGVGMQCTLCHAQLAATSLDRSSVRRAADTIREEAAAVGVDEPARDEQGRVRVADEIAVDQLKLAARCLDGGAEVGVSQCESDE